MKSQFEELKMAYKEGIKARKRGLDWTKSPYYPPKSTSYNKRTEWARGWLTGDKKSLDKSTRI